MKLFRMFGRSIRDALKSVIRNFSLSIASISCITITLVVVALSAVLSYNVDNFTQIIKKDVTVVVFLNNDITEKETNEVEEFIKDNKNIASYEFYSKKDVTDEMIESSEVFKSIMSKWEDEDNPLYDEFLIKVKNIELINDTAQSFEELEVVNSVKYGEGIVDRLLETFNVIQNIAIVMVGALLIVTAFLITNTIKLTIFSRKKEISIMRLVGASNTTIKLPFVIEGLFLGIIGAIIPIIITIYGYYAIYDYYGGQLFSPLIRLVDPFPFVYIVSAGLLGIGILVGMFGSAKAVRKHLKV